MQEIQTSGQYGRVAGDYTEQLVASVSNGEHLCLVATPSAGHCIFVNSIIVSVSTNVAETVDIKEAGTSKLKLFFGSAESRPVVIHFNGPWKLAAQKCLRLDPVGATTTVSATVQYYIGKD